MVNVGKYIPYMDPLTPMHLHHISTATHIHILQVAVAGKGKVRGTYSLEVQGPWKTYVFTKDYFLSREFESSKVGD